MTEKTMTEKTIAENLRTRTRVGIVGAGPAGLMLARLLDLAGVESVVIDHRSRETVEGTIRAGILESGSVKLLESAGAADGLHENGIEHEGICLRVEGQNHRVDFRDLVGSSVWLYQQTDVVADLARHHLAAGGLIHYGITGATLSGIEDSPQLSFTDSDGRVRILDCDLLVGADGSHSVCRKSIPESERRSYFREYPFAWFGILAEAPKSDPELVYANSPHGFALLSQRSESLQRMYFQCDPGEKGAAWSDEEIWAELRRRVNGNGFEVKEGPIVERVVLPFRSVVHEPTSYAKLLLVGDAAHTVPPTGAKGLNLAFADVEILAEVLVDYFSRSNSYLTGVDLLGAYSERAAARVWKAQQFSFWLTSMLHNDPNGNEFDRHRQRAELRSIIDSASGSTYLAEAYTGWPNLKSRSKNKEREEARAR